MARGIRVNTGQSYRKLEATARAVRAKLAPGLPATQALPGIELFENLTHYYVMVDGRKIPLTFGVKMLPGGVEAVTRYEADRGRILVAISEEMYLGLEQNQARARFCVAHEIGHAVLHAAELVRLAEIPHSEMGLYRAQQGRDHADFLDSEWQANSFAAALLMPAEGIAALERTYGQVWPILAANVFQTSQQATQIRADIFSKRRSELLRV